MRPKTSDIRTRRMSTPELGAVRSYATIRGGYVISLRSRAEHTRRDAWTVLHMPSGALTGVWSFGEAIALVRKLSTMPEDERARWVILPRDGGGQVLFDRASGQWWRRGPERPVTPAELEVMSHIRPLTEYQLAFTDAAPEMAAPVRTRPSALSMLRRTDQATEPDRSESQAGRRNR
jgi:hypothetical protein